MLGNESNNMVMPVAPTGFGVVLVMALEIMDGGLSFCLFS